RPLILPTPDVRDELMKATERFSTACFRGAVVAAGLLLLGAAGLFAQAPAAPAKVLVNDVIPQGNRLVPTQRVMSLINTKPGMPYSQDTVNEDVRRLYETKQFGNILVDLQYTPDGKVNVLFRFVEYPSTVSEIVYQGAKHLKNDELNTITGLRKG